MTTDDVREEIKQNMKALIDTCRHGLSQKRTFCSHFQGDIFAAATDQFSGYITAKSATDIYYLMHRCTHSDKASRKMLNQLFSLIGMLDTSAEDIFHALTSGNHRFRRRC